MGLKRFKLKLQKMATINYDIVGIIVILGIFRMFYGLTGDYYYMVISFFKCIVSTYNIFTLA